MASIFKEYKLGEVCKICRGVSFKGIHYLESGTPVLKIGNIQDGKVIKENLFYCDEGSHKIADEQWVRYGDVVITNLAPAGKVGINLTDIEFVLGGHAFKLLPNPEILDRGYLYYFLVNFPSQVESMITLGNVSVISVSSMERFKILIPDLETQRDIVRKLDIFRELREELKMRKRQGIYYRNKIMHDLQECAFTD
ncbi:type I restriction enzyme specificity HsdS domain protein [Mycoplasma haemocanis str. Illinois]|uniref:Type I restriction enzyme specificity HsdS domain protein n=1 Tax=Mycoplasma haemocanis (strain Illinois) TaxID=1111676 RepID=H6N6Y0_MYCHN|nr:restriction endonuclease subunit S [Mycoplasma haemocanis]AEW45402.1 type I restriction enzyme specificity HsdS domain protein [Mycoplasma haemocanis str. Illinois]